VASTPTIEATFWFTEGFDTRDLIDAKALLDEFERVAAGKSQLRAEQPALLILRNTDIVPTQPIVLCSSGSVWGAEMGAPRSRGWLKTIRRECPNCSVE
jgi:hypothetical protein